MDGQWITVTSATTRSVLNIVRMLGMPEHEFATPVQQQHGRDRLDRALRSWIAQREASECLKIFADAAVVASRVFTVADIVSDPVYAERGDIITVDDGDLGPVRMQAVIPRFRRAPGQVWRAGPPLGADNDLVCRQWLGLDPEEIEDLRARGVI
jgi:formyl-CoA transferase